MDTLDNTPRPAQGSSGPLVGIVVIILLLAAGGLYFFKVERGNDRDNAALQQTVTEDPRTEALKVTSSSDTTTAIEEDLGATDLGDFDAELTDLESQL